MAFLKWSDDLTDADIVRAAKAQKQLPGVDYVSVHFVTRFKTEGEPQPICAKVNTDTDTITEFAYDALALAARHKKTANQYNFFSPRRITAAEADASFPPMLRN